MTTTPRGLTRFLNAATPISAINRNVKSFEQMVHPAMMYWILLMQAAPSRVKLGDL
jgi:hypothetical protein